MRRRDFVKRIAFALAATGLLDVALPEIAQGDSAAFVTEDERWLVYLIDEAGNRVAEGSAPHPAQDGSIGTEFTIEDSVVLWGCEVHVPGETPRAVAFWNRQTARPGDTVRARLTLADI
jgi:hypothetical protein